MSVGIFQSVTLNKYNWSLQRSAINSLFPEVYNVTNSQLIVLSNIDSWNKTIKDNIERYVGGVYVKEGYKDKV